AGTRAGPAPVRRVSMTMRQGDLAIVIPVWNLPQDLESLLGQIADMGIFSQVVIADDASDPDCSPEALGMSTRLQGMDVLYLRSDVQRGAGDARNRGLQAVTAANVLFFDADDRLCSELPQILQHHLTAGQPDFTIFRHSDTRVEQAEGRRGTFATEEALWTKAMAGGSCTMLGLKERAELVLISAYPWNKIYRTDFLRDNDIFCSQTPVHNDIRLHWLSFLKAETVQATRTIGAVHVIGDRGHHLTARRGEDRLCLAAIIHELTDQIRHASGKQIIMQRFIQFVDNICRWNLDQVEDHLIPAFRTLAVDAYLDFSPAEFQLFSIQQPARADEIVRFLLAEGA
ncbi:MAG: glycosyltransferase, partial [Paracoccus sp. (in: a-proteobacteria)]|nr:glycosyltransferase [Paracoccus sp. (in: a-proteobacteria)]